MSKQQDYSLLYPVKNEGARKRLGFSYGFYWKTDESLARVILRANVAIIDAGFSLDDFKKPVRVHFPVVNDLPPEGVFDTDFCNRYERGGDDGLTMVLITGAVPVDQFHAQNEDSPNNTGTDAGRADAETGEMSEDHTEVFGNEDYAVKPGNLPAYAYNVNGEPMEEVEKEMNQPVARMSERHRILSQFILNDAFSHHVTPEQLAEVSRLELDMSNSYIQDMLLACHNVPSIQKLDTPNLWKFTDAFKRIFPQDKRHTLHLMMNFAQAFVDTDYIDRALLVKEWVKGNRVSCIDRTPSGANAGGGNLTDRGEGFVHDQASLARDVATGVLARSMDLDIYNLHPAHAKRVDEIVAENKPPFSVFRDKFIAMPGGLDYSRAIVVASVKEAPVGIEVISAHVTEYLNKVLTEADHANPDPEIVDIACGRSSAPMPQRGTEEGKKDDEEKPQSSVVLADEPATPETVEPDSTEHNQDSQPVDAQSQVEVEYQKIRADLHEARKNIPPKNIPVPEQISASDEGEKAEVHTEKDKEIPEKTAGDSLQEDNEGTQSDAGCGDAGNASDTVNAQWPSWFEPGRYEAIPNEVYHSANGISSTMLKDARISLMYYHGRHIAGTIPREESDALLRGRIIHSYVLETDKFVDEYTVPAPVPDGVVTTSQDLIAIIKEYNAGLPALMTPDELKAWIEDYNATLPAQVPMTGDKDAIGQAYLTLPGEFKRIVGDNINFTATAMKACIKEYNASLPPLLKTSGNREQLLDQIATVDPTLAENERAKFLPYNVSGTKEQLTEIVRQIRPDVVTIEDWQKQQEDANRGKALITVDMYEQAQNIHTALQNNPDAARLLNHPERKSEISYFGFDEDTGLEIRVRPDIEIRLPYESICADLKSVSLGYVRQERLKDRLHREIIERDYHLSAAMYCDVANLDKFFWIFVNKDAGYHWVAVVEASPELLELGRQEYRRTLRQINEALETNLWPAPITESYTDELNDFDLRRLEALSI